MFFPSAVRRNPSVSRAGLKALAKTYAKLLDQVDDRVINDNDDSNLELLSQGIREKLPGISNTEIDNLLTPSTIDDREYRKLQLNPKKQRKLMVKVEKDLHDEFERNGTSPFPEDVSYTEVLALTDPDFIRYYAKRAPEFMADYLKKMSSQPYRILYKWNPMYDLEVTSKPYLKLRNRTFKKAQEKHIPLNKTYPYLTRKATELVNEMLTDLDDHGASDANVKKTLGEQEALSLLYELIKVEPDYMRGIYTEDAALESDDGNDAKNDDEIERELAALMNPASAPAPAPPPAKKARGSGMKRKRIITGKGMKRKKSKKH